MDQDVYCVVNPAAGRGRTGRKWQNMVSALQKAGLRCQTNRTIGPGDATRLTVDAVQRGYPVILAAGGDGTINEVVNGLAACENGLSSTKLALMPTGSGNDLCRTLNLRDNPVALAKAILAGSCRMIDLCQAGTHFFLNMCGAGFDSEVSYDVNHKFRWLEGTATFAAYLTAICHNLFRFHAVPVTLILDGKKLETRAMMISVANGRFLGGGFKIAPEACLDDGLYDVCLIEDVGLFEEFRVMALLLQGRQAEHSKVHYYRARKVSIITKGKHLHLQGDGEMFGVTPVSFTIRKQALRLVVP